MNNHRQTEAGPGITLKDIYFVLFRHKWKLIWLSAAGILAAVAYGILRPTPYQSEAELFIRYVLDTRSPDPAPNGRETSSSQLGDSIIVNELHILTSFDIFQTVATNLGPDKIIGKPGNSDPVQAACIVKQNLTVDAPNNSSIIHLVFHHPDPAIVQPVLRDIIAAYLEKHLEVHQSAGTSDDFLTEQTAQLRSQILETEKALLAVKTNAGIISVPEAEKSNAEQMARIRGELLLAEAELAGQPAGSPGATNPVSAGGQPSADDLAEYQGLCLRLGFLEKQDNEYLNEQGYTEENKLVREGRGQMTALRQRKIQLEEKFPALAALLIPAPAVAGQPVMAASGMETVASLRARIQLLKDQFNQLQTEAAKVAQAEASLADLQRQQAIQEGNYQYFSTSLEQARIDAALGPGRVSNISTIQAPTPPFRDRSKQLKVMLLLALGGVAGGLAWAFMLEYYFDTSVKRSSEVESKLRLPLYLSIPDLRYNGYRKLAGRAAGRPLPAGRKPAGSRGTQPLEVATWTAGSVLNPFYDALRDRLMAYFESINLTRKPKLVAVTGANKGAGVSTIAAGLACSLSETGDGRVLLIDMNLERGAARQFVRGEQVCLLDDALAGERRDHALVQDNLYVVSECADNEKLQRVLPRRFATLVPKLKASDYDYIIFDMPSVSQTSVTARLAGLMDMTLLVIESEKTDRESVHQANVLLSLSKASVGAVLNKTRQHVPVMLHRKSLEDV